VVTDVVMPQMGLEVSEGTVVTFHVAAGAAVAEGDPLLEVETDKALTDVVAPCDGVVLDFAVAEGDTVEIGAVLVRLGGTSGDEAPRATEPATAETPVAIASAAATAERRRGAHTVRAAPVARRAARHHGLDLAAIAGTGPRGRITLRDVEAAVGSDGARTTASSATAEAPPAPPDGAGVRLSATRRAIARRMTASQLIPQFVLERRIDATWLLAEKARITAEGAAKVTVNDLLVQALAATVTRHPDLATSFVEPDRIVHAETADVGIAVATDRGLLVPVVRRAHERTLGETALERARLVAAARAGSLGLAEMSGATISLSNLGSFGVDRFTAMLNPGEAAIVAVGRTVDEVVPRDRGFAVIPALSLSMTLDHRVVDGATGAGALSDLAALLEGAMEWRP